MRSILSALVLLFLAGCADEPPVQSDETWRDRGEEYTTLEGKLSHAADAIFNLNVPTEPLVLAGGADRLYAVSRDEVESYREARKSRPDDLEALLGLARSLRLSGSPKEAAGLLAGESSKHSKNPGFLSEFAKANLAAGETRRAIALFEAAMEIGTSDWRDFSALGIAYDFERAHEYAYMLYETALGLSPRNPAVINNMAVSTLLRGGIDDALLLLESIPSDNPRRHLTNRNILLFKRVKKRLETCPNRHYECREKIIQEIGAAIYGIGKLKKLSPPPSVHKAPAAEKIIAKLKPAPVTKTAAIDLRVNFEFASAVLTPEAKEALNSLGQALVSEELAGYRFRLEGHTDAVGSEPFNQALSEDRARAVKDYLVGSFNIGPSRLETAGYGESRLLDPSDPFNDINRRVRISVIGIE
ncbi:MAG: OmpA family protein [Rhodospirillales bacterium]